MAKRDPTSDTAYAATRIRNAVRAVARRQSRDLDRWLETHLLEVDTTTGKTGAVYSRYAEIGWIVQDLLDRLPAEQQAGVIRDTEALRSFR